MKRADLKEFLDAKVIQYNHIRFLENDPIGVPHAFSRKKDIEISAFLTATIAWGNRKTIIGNAHKLMSYMDNAPYDFIAGHDTKDLDKIASFVHRTFKGEDLIYFISSLHNMYSNHGGLENIFARAQEKTTMQPAISSFKQTFFELPYPPRTLKHISDPLKGSAAKRINMFLRWMVRDATTGVDFGLWKSIKPSQLSCPLDVHSGNVARKLKLITRKQNDAKTLAQLDKNLRLLDANDPVKYDFALFGLGAFEKF